MRRLSKGPVRAGLSLMMALAWGMAARTAPAQEQVFTFSPPAKPFVVTSKDTRIYEVPGEDRRTEVSTVKSQVTVRRTARSYAVTHAVLSATDTRNGKPNTDPITTALRKRPFTYETDPTGKMTGIRDMEGFHRGALNAMPLGLRARMGERLTPAMMEEMLRTEWANLYGHLLGRPARAGEAWEARGQYTIPSGELLPSSVTVRVVGPAPCKSGGCVKTVLTHVADPEGAKMALEDSIAQSMKLQDTPGVRLDVRDLRSSETAEIVADPATLRIHSRQVTGGTTFSMDVGGQVTMPVRLDQRVQEWYDYNPKPAKPAPAAKAKPKRRRR
jgi:hypothetical protein